MGDPSDNDNLERLVNSHLSGAPVMSEFKTHLLSVVIKFLDSYRENRKKLEQNPSLVEAILENGRTVAKANASKTIALVEGALYKGTSDPFPRVVQLNYDNYIQVKNILSLAHPYKIFRQGEKLVAGTTREFIHEDEALFIRVHQTIEILWAQAIQDLTKARNLLGQPHLQEGSRNVPERDISQIVAALRRANEVLKHSQGSFKLLNLMSPDDFLRFRSAFGTASGFQSMQYRKLNAILGLQPSELMKALPTERREKILETFKKMLGERYSQSERDELAKMGAEQSLRTATIDWLSRTPISESFPDFCKQYIEKYRISKIGYGSDQSTTNDNKLQVLLDYLAGYGDAKLAKAHLAVLFIQMYRNEPLLTEPNAILNELHALDQTMQDIRWLHAQIVERQIGEMPGSAGGGLELLRALVYDSIFPFLKISRTFGINPSLMPDRPPHVQFLNFFRDPDTRSGGAEVLH